ncbi:STAS domain-containing protein [Rhodoferax aquaticus]|uniref:STAS domain-containing protein n=1 Tax=Rhodoferax aquaticus TaxID=2527691 RepID=A0A515EMM0_9BURK|nr:STAS domain-containing protein [Rhodoferax aquaticus]QDL53892.1 STAS domain-containing protein [Rhodoferax aquaticus]
MRKPEKENLSQPDSEMQGNSEQSRAALAQRIDRKRQDDQIRRREFNYLRKLRGNALTNSTHVAGRPSVFQSSVGSKPDERAMTIKKIDAIEAHMHDHWMAKNKLSSNAPVRSAQSVNHAEMSPALAQAAAARKLEIAASANATPIAVAEPPRLTAQVQSGRVNASERSAFLPSSGPAVDPLPASVKPDPVAHPIHIDGAPSDFSSSKLMTTEFDDGTSDTDLQDAAIRFAEGDYAGAETALISLMQAPTASSEASQRCALALFDMYRATGQETSFDVIAIEYAQRYGLSAPEWYSIPDLLDRKTSVFQTSPVTPVTGGAAWICPTVLDAAGMRNLQLSMAGKGASKPLNWGGLQRIAADALPSLRSIFSDWCAQVVELQFVGVDALLQQLEIATPVEARSVDMDWWLLRMDVLCVLRKQEAFDMAALDYCVTYEVSPPSWKNPRCTCSYDTLEVQASVHGGFESTAYGAPSALFSDSPASSFADSGMGDTARVELSGEVLGDAMDLLDPSSSGMLGPQYVLVSCARLVRVDFSAAGSILNWVAMRESQGCEVQFSDMSRLVAVFFRVIGIDAHARISVRTK